MCVSVALLYMFWTKRQKATCLYRRSHHDLHLAVASEKPTAAEFMIGGTRLSVYSEALRCRKSTAGTASQPKFHLEKYTPGLQARVCMCKRKTAHYNLAV